jgi:HTH-like domain
MKWYRPSRFPGSFRVGFLIAGVQKAGTFSLFQLLRQHPNIGMSTAKEVHLFDAETTVDWSKPASLRLMCLIDEQFRETPWYGSRQMARHLRRNGWYVGRHPVRRLMTKMGLAPIYQHPKTSEPHPRHKDSL